MAIKDSNYYKFYSINPLYLIFRNVTGYFEEIESKEIIKKI